MNYAPSQPGDRDQDPPELDERRNGEFLVVFEANNINAYISGIPREVKP